MNMTDPRITAIRNDHRIGRGSCSSIDECYSDRDLVQELDEAGADTPEAALAYAYESEGLWLEKGANATSGEPDCPLVASRDAWNPDTTVDADGIHWTRK